VALAKVVFTNREHIIALEPRGKGMVGVTLRYPYEIREEKNYFDDIPNESVPKDMLELATHIVHSKAGHFKPDKFEDKYESALREIIKRKQHGEKIEAPKEREPAKVIDLMDALRRSAKGAKSTPARRTAHRSTGTRTAKKTSRSTARHRKAG
jgi:Ku protein